MPRRKRSTVSASSGPSPASARLMRPVCSRASLVDQGFALGGGEKKTLPAIGVAGLLHDVALVHQLLQHAAERLLGDAQHLEQVGDLQPRIAADEMHHAVMGAAEAERLQHMVGVADEIAIGEKQQLDDVPARLAGPAGGGPAASEGARFGLKFMSAILTYLVFMLQKCRSRRNIRLFRLRPRPARPDKRCGDAASACDCRAAWPNIPDFARSAKSPSPGLFGTLNRLPAGNGPDLTLTNRPPRRRAPPIQEIGPWEFRSTRSTARSG